jgi:TATA-box binding protein (TBP) (component of TFIID and TFIIIB)
MSVISSHLLAHPIRISTMTQVASLTTKIDLRELFASLPKDGTDVLTYAIHGYEAKGDSGKKKKVMGDETVGGKTRKRYFFNQVTLHVQVGKQINMKVFNNGGIQMTGLRSETQGSDAIACMVAYVKSLDAEVQQNIFVDSVSPVCESSRMVMINSDFDLKMMVDREKLHRHVVSAGHYSSYSPEIYPGVNIKYYYNLAKQQTGICNCDGVCDGKGHNGACKKVTVAVFRSGKVIITGGQHMDQIHTAHEFICGFVKEREEDIRENRVV